MTNVDPDPDETSWELGQRPVRLRNATGWPAPPSTRETGPVDSYLKRQTFPDFSDVVRPPAWHERAACRGRGHEIFFPSSGRNDEGRRAASKIYQTCQVRGPCLAYALDHYEHGTWGGIAEKARDEIRQDRSTVKRILRGRGQRDR